MMKALIALVILVVQIIVSTLWLRRFGHGPLEKLWRLVTWGSVKHSATHRHQHRDQPGALTSSRE